MENKEYKIITSNTPSFASTDKLRQILAEEAQTGWQLVEKFDNYRIRLMRDVSARANDADSATDPYRTHVGINNFVYLGAAALGTLVVIYIVIRLAALSV